jgi:hypothetical protein
MSCGFEIIKENLIEHEDEISARPARTWYQSETAKKKTKVAAKAAVESGAILFAITGNATTATTDITFSFLEVNGMN